MPFLIKRAYEKPSESDGKRVLIDRLWPRGLKKSDANLAQWLKEVAPSPALRLWFDHRADRLAEFDKRYRAELKNNAAVGQLRKLGTDQTVTLVYASRDPRINHAVVLMKLLKRTRASAPSGQLKRQA